MNLVTRFTLLFVFVSLMVFVVGGVITYQVMKREIDAEQQRFLVDRLRQTERFIERRSPTQDLIRGKLMIHPLDEVSSDTTIVFSDTLVMHSTLQRLEPHLKLETTRTIEGRSYEVIIYDIIIEADDISEVVTESLTKTYLILLVAFTLLGLVASYFQLRPFRISLDIIRNFSVSKKIDINFPRTSINEFRQLNKFLSEMIFRAQNDYHALKEFSENASHELQTPIAIMKAKLDVLLQDEKLNEEQLRTIDSLQLTTKRLSDLSSSLSLLTKIENKEFSKLEEVDVVKTYDQVVDGFSELLDIKGIRYGVEKKGDPVINADPVLIEILITNLINNAIKHNIPEGSIKTTITKDGFVVNNTGNPLQVDSSELFKRFKKSNQSDSSLGLGLAIVKKICDFYQFRISYENKSEQHSISIVFNG